MFPRFNFVLFLIMLDGSEHFAGRFQDQTLALSMGYVSLTNPDFAHFEVRNKAGVVLFTDVLDFAEHISG
jgi:hypothetical protein